MFTTHSILVLAALAVVSPLASGTAAAQSARATALAHAQHDAREITITMKEYAFEIDPAISSGPHAVTIRNAGHQGHLMILTQLSSGRTSLDVVSWLQHKTDTVPGEIVVTTIEVKPGKSTQIALDLAPGRYSLVCTVPGWWNRPHYKSGMLRDIVVP